MHRKRLHLSAILTLAAFLIAHSPPAPAQEAENAVAVYPANPADVASVDAIMDAVYDVISGPAGAARDWNRFRSLFIDGARLIPRAPDSPGGALVLSPEDYIERARGSFSENGFFESEIGRKTDRYGHIVHVFSAYEARRSADNPEPFVRGVNSFQLLHHDNRWWIVTIFWESETPDTPIPLEYLTAQ